MHSIASYLIILFLTVISQGSRAAGPIVPNVDSILSELDAAIATRPALIERKEQRLNNIRRTYQEALSPEQRFSLANTLFSEYQYYQSDSALHYAFLSEEIARELGNSSFVHEARIRQSACYARVGIFNEAVDILNTIEESVLNIEQDIYYYQVRAFIYYNLMCLSQSDVQLRQRYCDNACASLEAISALTSAGSLYHEVSLLKVRMLKDYTEISTEEITGFVTRFDVDKRHASELYSVASWMAYSRSDFEQAVYLCAQSAIWDIETCTRENLSSLFLAKLLFQQGEIEKASQYFSLAQDDALAYGSQMRQLQINPVASVIGRSWQMKLAEERVLALYIIGGGLILLSVLIWYIVRERRQNRQLKQMTEALRISFEQQKQGSDQLAELNRQLSDAVDIKNRYIFESLMGSPGFVNEVERTCLTVEKRLMTKQYSEALSALNSLDIKRERDRQLSAFDTALLRLFPTFLIEYNKLFPADGRVRINANGTLPAEVRIFALMRLGVTDTEHVASYLNISTNSLYVYKAKARARALVDKVEFDKKIMSIGVTSPVERDCFTLS